MTMLANFVTLVQLSVCQKQQEVVPYNDYDVDEENGGQDLAASTMASKTRWV
jgi:hypothetical protein